MTDAYQIPVRLIATTPTGDIPIREGAGKKHLPGGPQDSDAESDLRYGPYLASVRHLLMQRDCEKILASLAFRLGRIVELAEIEWIEIRTEKHGAYYHVARADLNVAGNIVPFAVNVAVSDEAKSVLQRDFSLLRKLGRRSQHQCLPQVYFKGAGRYRESDKGIRWLHMFVAEWFSGYYEFHLHLDRKDRSYRVLLWDFDHDSCYLSREQSLELYRQAARILTLYYDWSSFKQIYPWHHAAGDFVVKVEKGRVDLRLITVRGYEPVVDFKSRKRAAKSLALILFFLQLTIQMRLDRLDGVGDVVWAEDYCLEGTVAGFFEGLASGDAKVRRDIPSVGEILDLLRSFTKEEWLHFLVELLEITNFSQEELSLISDRGENHIEYLQHVLAKIIL
jgi:hypothetical protein